MNIEWLITNVTATGSPARADWWFILDIFVRRLANSGRICGQGATLWSGNPFLSNWNLTYVEPIMKIEWLTTNITAVGSSARAEREKNVWF